MSWADKVSNATIRFYESIRSKRTGEAVVAEADGELSSLRGHKYALVITFRSNGDAVSTPVWFGIDDGRLYFRSVATGAKLRRITRHPAVLVAPCTLNGRPTGAPFRAEARLLSSARDEATAEAAIRKNYRLGRRLYAQLIGTRVAGRYVEVCP